MSTSTNSVANPLGLNIASGISYGTPSISFATAPSFMPYGMIGRALGFKGSLTWTLACPECQKILGNISLPCHRAKIVCKACDQKYSGEISIHSVTIAGETCVFEVQEGVCTCGCHNASRAEFRGMCQECKTYFESYMSILWDRDFYNYNTVAAGTTVFPSGTQWTYSPAVICTTSASTGISYSPIVSCSNP